MAHLHPPSDVPLVDLVPPIASHPAALLRIVGTSSVNMGIVYFSLVERRTSRSLGLTHKAQVLILCYTALYVLDPSGRVARMVRIVDIASPATVLRQSTGSEGQVSGVLIHVKGEQDLLLYFIDPTAAAVNASATCHSDAAVSMALELNRQPEDRASGQHFIKCLKTLFDAFSPAMPLLLDDVAKSAAAQVEKGARLTKQQPAGGSTASSKAQQIALQDAAIRQKLQTLPVAAEILHPKRGGGAGGDAVDAGGLSGDAAAVAEADGILKDLDGVVGGGGGAGGGQGGSHADEIDALKQRIRRLALGKSHAVQAASDQATAHQQRADELSARAEQLEFHLSSIEEERNTLQNANHALQSRLDELSARLIAGESTLDDFTRLAQQLLAVQRQLLTERMERYALVENAREHAEKTYDSILLKQQDDLDHVARKARSLESVFRRLKGDLLASTDAGDDVEVGDTAAAAWPAALAALPTAANTSAALAGSPQRADDVVSELLNLGGPIPGVPAAGSGGSPYSSAAASSQRRRATAAEQFLEGIDIVATSGMNSTTITSSPGGLLPVSRRSGAPNPLVTSESPSLAPPPRTPTTLVAGNRASHRDKMLRYSLMMDA